MKKKVVSLLKIVLLILALCIPILQFGNGVDVQAAIKLATPKLVSAKAQGTSKIKVTWKKVSGADGYKVYRKEYGDKKWKSIKNISNNTTTFTDTKVESGMYYSYTVRAVKNKTILSGYDKKGVYAVTSLDYPSDLKARIVRGDVIEISWKDNFRSSGYCIYRRTENSSWKLIENCCYVSYFEDYSAKSGIQYYYTVRQCVEYDKVYKGLYDKNGIKAPIIPQKKPYIEFTKTEIMLVKGGKSQSLEEFVEYNCDEDKIKWTSSDANVATVNAHGEIIGINYGEAIISAEAYGKVCKCTIKVVPYMQVEKTDYIIDSETVIDIQYAQGAVGSISYQCIVDNNDIISYEWAGGSYINGYYVQKLRIIPRMNGRTNIKLSTDRFHDEVLMLNIIVQNVKTLSVDNSNIITSSPTAVYITSTTGHALTYYITGEDTIRCMWGKWSEWNNHKCTIPLYIVPYVKGTNTIIITDKVTNESISVNVSTV